MALFVSVDGEVVPVAVEIQGVEMAMGFLRLPLEPRDGGWGLQADLPACTTDCMLRKADVVLEDRVAGFFLWSTR